MISFCISRYDLLFYINPQYYGYSAIAKVLLKDKLLSCKYDSTLECRSSDGNAILAKFGFDVVNPYEHMLVSISFILRLVKEEK